MRLRRAPANPGAEMSLLEHIAELRDRIIKGCLALAVTTTGAFFFLYEPSLRFITRSYCEIPARYRVASAAGRCALLNTGVLEPISVRMRLSATLGLVLAIPVIAYQLWRFVTPGLRPNEKRYAIPFALASTVLFACGVAVAFLTLPKAVNFLVTIGGSQMVTFFAADRYLRFVLFMALAFGLTFEFPLLLVSLSMVGLLSSKAMLKAWRPAIIVIIVAAAVITPSQDPFSLFAMAVPMWLFYFGAAWFAKLVIEPARARRQAARG
jgi:sec-independent protein translocase protein TatC